MAFSLLLLLLMMPSDVRNIISYHVHVHTRPWNKYETSVLTKIIVCVWVGEEDWHWTWIFLSSSYRLRIVSCGLFGWYIINERIILHSSGNITDLSLCIYILEECSCSEWLEIAFGLATTSIWFPTIHKNNIRMGKKWDRIFVWSSAFYKK